MHTHECSCLRIILVRGTCGCILLLAVTAELLVEPLHEPRAVLNWDVVALPVAETHVVH